MNIAEMHIWFRQFAQQMGMQNVRAILSNQIDILINTAISDTINDIIAQNVKINNNRVIEGNTKIAQLNALSTLYKVDEIDFNELDEESRAFIPNTEYYKNGRFDILESYKLPEVLYWVNFNISYVKAKNGWKYTPNGWVIPVVEDKFSTNLYPVRIIDESFLANTLNDFILKNKITSPILVFNNEKFELYVDTLKKIQGEGFNEFILANNFVPNKLRMSYIAKPDVVHYDIDESKCINCNLPQFLHIDILKRAVDLYRIVVSGTLHSNQEQQ